jgi:hypothetical protein
MDKKPAAGKLYRNIFESPWIFSEQSDFDGQVIGVHHKVKDKEIFLHLGNHLGTNYMLTSDGKKVAYEDKCHLDNVFFDYFEEV